MRIFRNRQRDHLPLVIPAPVVLVREDPLAMRARHTRIALEARTHQLEFSIAELRTENLRLYHLWQGAEIDLRRLRAEREVR